MRPAPLLLLECAGLRRLGFPLRQSEAWLLLLRRLHHSLGSPLLFACAPLFCLCPVLRMPSHAFPFRESRLGISVMRVAWMVLRAGEEVSAVAPSSRSGYIRGCVGRARGRWHINHGHRRRACELVRTG
ncbi:MAG: hypothetical protein WCI75_16170 [candidate division NC10 bacterium]